jgi:hypothetical protein
MDGLLKEKELLADVKGVFIFSVGKAIVPYLKLFLL